MFPIVILFLMSTELLCFVPESELFSSGHSEGDFLLFPNDDQHSAVQNISIVFKFFHEHHSKLFVSEIAYRHLQYTKLLITLYLV